MTFSPNNDYAPPAMFMWSWIDAWTALQEVMALPDDELVLVEGVEAEEGSHEWWVHHFKHMRTDTRHMEPDERKKHLEGVKTWHDEKRRQASKERAKKASETGRRPAPEEEHRGLLRGPQAREGRTQTRVPTEKRTVHHPHKEPGEKPGPVTTKMVPHFKKGPVTFEEPKGKHRERKRRWKSGERHDGTDVKSVFHMQQALKRLSGDAETTDPESGKRTKVKDILLSLRSHKTLSGMQKSDLPQAEKRQRGVLVRAGKEGGEKTVEVTREAYPHKMTMKHPTRGKSKPFKPSKRQQKSLDAAGAGSSQHANLLKGFESAHSADQEQKIEKRFREKLHGHKLPVKDNRGKVVRKAPDEGWSEKNPHPDSYHGKIRSHEAAKKGERVHKGTERGVAEPLSPGQQSAALSNIHATAVAGHGDYHHHDKPEAVQKALERIRARRAAHGSKELHPDHPHGYASIALDTGIEENRVKSMAKGHSVIPMRDLAHQADRHVKSGGKLDDGWVAKGLTRLLSKRAESKKSRKKKAEVKAGQDISGGGKGGDDKQTSGGLGAGFAAMKASEAGTGETGGLGGIESHVSRLGRRLKQGGHITKEMLRHPGDAPHPDASKEEKKQHPHHKARHEALARLLGEKPTASIDLDKSVTRLTKKGKIHHPGDEPEALPPGASEAERTAHREKHANAKAAHEHIAKLIHGKGGEKKSVDMSADNVGKIVGKTSSEVERVAAGMKGAFQARPARAPRKSAGAGVASGKRQSADVSRFFGGLEKKQREGERTMRSSDKPGKPTGPRELGAGGKRGTGRKVDEPLTRKGEIHQALHNDLHDVFPLDKKTIATGGKDGGPHFSATREAHPAIKRKLEKGETKEGLWGQHSAATGGFRMGGHKFSPAYKDPKRKEGETVEKYAARAAKKKAAHTKRSEQRKQKKQGKAYDPEWHEHLVKSHEGVHKVVKKIVGDMSDPDHPVSKKWREKAAERARLSGHGRHGEAAKTGEVIEKGEFAHHLKHAAQDPDVHAALGVKPGQASAALSNVMKRLEKHGTNLAFAKLHGQGGVPERRPSGLKTTADTKKRLKKQFEPDLSRTQLVKPTTKPGFIEKPRQPSPTGSAQEPLSSAKRREKKRPGDPGMEGRIRDPKTGSWSEPLSKGLQSKLAKSAQRQRSKEAGEKLKKQQRAGAKTFAQKVRAGGKSLIPMAAAGKSVSALTKRSTMRLPKSVKQIGRKQTGRVIGVRPGGPRVTDPRAGEQEPSKAQKAAQERALPKGMTIPVRQRTDLPPLKPGEKRAKSTRKVGGKMVKTRLPALQPSERVKAARKKQDVEIERKEAAKREAKVASERGLQPLHVGPAAWDPEKKQPKPQKGAGSPGVSRGQTFKGMDIRGETTRAVVGKKAIRAAQIRRSLLKPKAKPAPKPPAAPKTPPPSAPPPSAPPRQRVAPPPRRTGEERFKTPSKFAMSAITYKSPKTEPGKKPKHLRIFGKEERKAAVTARPSGEAVPRKPESPMSEIEKKKHDIRVVRRALGAPPAQRQKSQRAEQGRPGEQKGTFTRSEGGAIKKEESILSRSSLTIHESGYFKSSLFTKVGALT